MSDLVRRAVVAGLAILASCGNDATSGQHTEDAVGDAVAETATGVLDAQDGAADGAADIGAADAPEREATSPETQTPFKVVRAFRCRPAAVSALADIAEVDGQKGATVAITPVDSECHYDLVYRAAPDATPVVLSRAAGGFLWAIAGRAPSGRVVACASDIQHRADSGGVAATGELARTIDSVRLSCAARADDGHWGPFTTLVDTDGTYAAWALGLEQSDARADGFRVAWVRDVSFQFLSLTDVGRPSTDGVWTTDFVAHADGTLGIGASRRVGAIMGGVEGSEGGAWLPTASEKTALGDAIDFGDGACGGPAGCALPGATP